MPTVTEYAQGIPSWFDLGVPDQEAAKSFYADIFGWTYVDNPMEMNGEPAGTYSMAMIGGNTPGGVFTQPKEHIEQGMPPAWQVYFTVNDIDASTAQVSELGGTVVVEPFNVEPMPSMTIGRMSIIQDPGGAHANLWQAISHIGASVRGEHGAIHWIECLSGDKDASVSFYTELFGVSMMSMPGMEEGYYMVAMIDGQPAFGVMDIPQEATDAGAPPHWGIYFHVDDIDATMELAVSKGAKVLTPAFDLQGVSRIGHIFDPQGAVLGLGTPTAM